MRVRQVMSRSVEVVPTNASLADAARIMRRKEIGFLPVVEDGSVVGVVTDRDLVVRGMGEGRNPSLTAVAEVMTRALIWCYADEVLTVAAEIMESNHIRRVLVLDMNKKLIGLLSLDDLAAKMSSDRLLGTIVRHVTEAA